MEHEWDFYFCLVEDQPASVFLDLSLRDFDRIDEINELIWVRVIMRDPRPDGLSSKDEMAALCEIEDALSSAAENTSAETLYAGRNTSGGSRDFYFYSATRDVESEFAKALAAHPQYSYEIGGRTDPDWQVYFCFLYPGPREFQTIQNGRVVRQLEEHGDQLDEPREVQHWIYFEQVESRTTFLSRLARTGFEVADEHDEGPDDRPYVLNLIKTHAVNIESVNDEVMRLYDLTVQCDGDYDGWETAVVTAESP